MVWKCLICSVDKAMVPVILGENIHSVAENELKSNKLTYELKLLMKCNILKYSPGLTHLWTFSISKNQVMNVFPVKMKGNWTMSWVIYCTSVSEINYIFLPTKIIIIPTDFQKYQWKLFLHDLWTYLYNLANIWTSNLLFRWNRSELKVKFNELVNYVRIYKFAHSLTHLT